MGPFLESKISLYLIVIQKETKNHIQSQSTEAHLLEPFLAGRSLLRESWEINREPYSAKLASIRDCPRILMEQVAFY